jgi:shikimate dehydrogenase
LAEAIAVSSLVVNATTLGLGGAGAPPIPIFPPQAAYYDIVYGAEPTPFLRAASAAGARTAGGRSMLLHQGALAWEIWTGKPAPLEAMRRALNFS